MSLADEIRDALKNASGPLTAEEIYAKCASAKTVDHISTNISAFVQRGEVQRQNVLGQRAGTFIINPRYVKGQPGTAGEPRIVAGKSGMGGVAKAAKDQRAEDKPSIRQDNPPKLKKARKKAARDEWTKEAAAKFKLGKRAKKPKKLNKKARRVAVKDPAVPVSIRYDTAAPPQPLQASAPEPRPTGAAVFGIRDDGALGIDTGHSNVQINKADIARLRTFIEASKPLWI